MNARSLVPACLAVLPVLAMLGCASPVDPGDEDDVFEQAKDDDGNPIAESTLGADGEEDPANGEIGTVSAAATAASCVRLGTWWQPSNQKSVAQLNNLCKTSKRVRLIWRWAADGKCVNLEPGQASYYEMRSGKNRPNPYVIQVRKC